MSNSPFEKEIRAFERELGLHKVRYEEYRKVIKDKGWISDLSRKALEEAFESIGCAKALQSSTTPNWNEVLDHRFFNKSNRYSVTSLLYLGILLCREVKMVTIKSSLRNILLTSLTRTCSLISRTRQCTAS